MGNLSISTSGSFTAKVSLDISSLTYSGAYSVNPGAFSQVLPVKDLLMSNDLTINAFPLASTMFTSNGVYFASDENVGGYSQVTVSIPFYNGSYEVIPSGVSISLPTSGRLMQSDIMVNAIPLYSGSYNITPIGTSQILPTSGKYLSSDIVVGSASGGGGGGDSTYVDNFKNMVQRSPGSIMDTDGLCSHIGADAFAGYIYLTEVAFPECKSVYRSAFYNCQALISVSLPKCLWVDSGAFRGCTSLTSVYLPECTYISSNAFMSCRNISSLYLPECVSIYNGAFYGASNIVNLDLPKCTLIDNGAFGNCLKLESVSLPKLKLISTNAFSNCSLLKELDLPECTEILSSALNGSGNTLKLSHISIPKCKNIDSNAFLYQTDLTAISIPSCSYIYPKAFMSCYNLISVYLLGSYVVWLGNSNVFQSTPIDGYSVSAGQYGSIFVPESLYDTYVGSSLWSRYSSRFVSVAI